MSNAAGYWGEVEFRSDVDDFRPENLPRNIELTRDAALEWLSWPKWTVLEAVLLLTGSDPKGWIDPDRPDWGVQLARRRFQVEDEIEAALISSLKVKNIGDGGAKFYTLEGTACRGLQHTQWDALSFPVASYVAWAYKTLFPNFKKGRDLPIFGLFHNAEKEATEEKSQFFGVFEPIEQDFLQVLQKIGADEKFAQWESEAVSDAKKAVYPEDALADALNRHNIQVHQEQKREESGAFVKDETAVIDGLTVAGVRAAFKYSPALRDIVAAVAEVQAMPCDGVQKPTAKTLEAKIKLKAKAHGWGSAKDGALSDTQWKGLKSVVLGLDRGGRPTK